jgi:hypothetical protein
MYVVLFCIYKICQSAACDKLYIMCTVRTKKSMCIRHLLFYIKSVISIRSLFEIQDQLRGKKGLRITWKHKNPSIEY